MKTLFVSLAALVAVSSAALATSGTANLTAFERMNLISQDNEDGKDHGRAHAPEPKK